MKNTIFKNKAFIKVVPCILIIALVLIRPISQAENKGRSSFRDPLTGEIYVYFPGEIQDHFPPIELLEGKSDPHEIHAVLDLWRNKLDASIKDSVKKYFECDRKLDELEQKFEKAHEEYTKKLAEYNNTRDTLKRMLVAVLGRLGLQTAVVMTDAATDLQLALKKVKDVNKSGAKTRTDMKRARQLAEFETLKEKAVALRRLKIKQSLYVQSLERAFRKPIRVEA